MRLEGKIVLVTGAARNLGRAIALECAANGAHVAVNYARSADEAQTLVDEIRALGRDACAIQGDVGDYAQTDAMVKRTVAEFGRIDVLVNNAGLLLRSLLMMMEPQDFERVVRTNLLGAFHGVKAASRHMIKQRGGSIVNISSLAGQRGLVGQGAYSSSKAGMDSLTTIAAKELARYGVRVNGVAPGTVDTGMMGQLTEEVQQSYLRDIPLKRYGQPAEIARGVVFLASDDASYITGQTLTIDGGMVC